MRESFYGGAPGVSFIIVANYSSIDEMVENFQKGPDYEAVHFDEHVLINTKNKNNVDNGKIFRRGYDYNNDMGGAIYIGTIVGPMGPAPMVEMTTFDDVIEKQPEPGYSYRFTEGEYAPLYNLVPGKTDDGEYHDSIKWACCSMRDESDLDVTAYIGFIFPYLVVDYEANTVSAYYNRDSDEAGFTNTDLVDRMDDESHPYWEKWHISVPKGIKGDTFQNFRVITASDSDGVEPYDGQDDDRANSREILVYDYYHYDKEEGGEPVTIYLGDYNMITGITIDDDGTVTIEYSHDDTLQYPNLFKWIKEVTIDLETGLFQVIYNYDEEADGTPTIYQTYLDWVQDITMTHEGVVTIHYPNPDYDHDLDEIIKWVDEITFEEDGTLSIYYNTGEEVHWNNQVKWITEVGLTDDGDFHISFNNGDDDYTTHLTWVNDIVFENDGTISVHYNDGTDDFTYKNLIQWITNVSLSEDGHFVISFNNDADDYETDLVWVREVTFEEDGIVTVTYNNGDVVTYPNIKWITGIELAEDGSFHIDFNNGDEYNTNLVWVTEVSFAEDGIVTVTFNNGETIEYPNIKWITNISLAEDGTFEIDFNNGDEYDTNLVWPTKFEVADDGTVTITYNNGESTIYSTLIKWITGVSLSEEGHFVINFNTPDADYETDLVWPTKFEIADNGTVTITYNNGESTIYTTLVKWITEVSLSEEGHFVISFNTPGADYETDLVWVSDLAVAADGTVTITYNNGTTQNYNQLLKTISNIYIDSDDQKIHIVYNTGEEETVGEPLNYIEEVAVSEENYHLLVYYSDPAKRAEVGTVTYEGKDGWLDLGSVKDDAGILVGKNYELSSISSITADPNKDLETFIDQCISYINSQYPSGLTGANLAGKVVTIGDEYNNKYIFAFDYSSNVMSWYYLGKLGDDVQIDLTTALIFATSAEATSEVLDEVPTGGVWFVLEEI